MMAMKKSALFLPLMLAVSASAQTMDHNAMQSMTAPSTERLGTVSFRSRALPRLRLRWIVASLSFMIFGMTKQTVNSAC
jgi:hypothetical protein